MCSTGNGGCGESVCMSAFMCQYICVCVCLYVSVCVCVCVLRGG